MFADFNFPVVVENCYVFLVEIHIGEGLENYMCATLLNLSVE